MDAQASFFMLRPEADGFFAGTRPGEFRPGMTMACHSTTERCEQSLVWPLRGTSQKRGEKHNTAASEWG